MIPTTFKESNFVYTKPADLKDEECLDLPVFRGNTTDGYPVNVSCWKLTVEDLAEVQKNGVIYLQIYGNGHPMVSLSAESPFFYDNRGPGGKTGGE
jgi:hypothetical protein